MAPESCFSTEKSDNTNHLLQIMRHSISDPETAFHPTKCNFPESPISPPQTATPRSQYCILLHIKPIKKSKFNQDVRRQAEKPDLGMQLKCPGIDFLGLPRHGQMRQAEVPFFFLPRRIKRTGSRQRQRPDQLSDSFLRREEL